MQTNYTGNGDRPERLSGEDLSFWWMDSPQQPTTMAMVMLLDHAPQPARLRHAFERAIAAVPRLRQRVVEAPFGVTLPRWELDPTFDLDFHLRRHSVTGRQDVAEVFREVTPVYEAPFDRSRPLWEARIYDGLRGDAGAAMFFKLHHAVADGVGGNAIFAAMTDSERDAADVRIPQMDGKGAWPESSSFGRRLLAAVRDRIDLDLGRAATVMREVAETVQHPERVTHLFAAVQSISETLRFEHQLPLQAFGRARHLSGLDLPFAEVHALKQTLGGAMIDVLLTIMARALMHWQRLHGINGVREVMTLVPVNLRTPQQWAEQPSVGNVATGILVPLPLWHRDPLACHRDIRTRMAAKKADPASTASPLLADMLSVFPQRILTWMSEASFGLVDFIVTNVPGILATRYLAGAEIRAAYPFAPVAMRSPVSVALYGYRDRLFIGINSDEIAMPDAERFAECIRLACREMRRAVQPRRSIHGRTRRIAARA